MYENLRIAAVFIHFYLEEKQMRIILDTDKKTITVPWNYQQKLDDINRIIMEVSNDESKKRPLPAISTNCGVSASRI